MQRFPKDTLSTIQDSVCKFMWYYDDCASGTFQKGSVEVYVIVMVFIICTLTTHTSERCNYLMEVIKTFLFWTKQL